MEPETGIATVGHAIQLSVAPVFLLSGIGAMLAVMTNRLARVVDRARALEARLPQAAPEDIRLHHAQLATYSRRAKLINRAITFCTTTALLICAVVATLFVGAFMRYDASVVVAVLFILAMSSLFIGLLHFLREIFVATAALRIGPR
jgi:Cu/Ag efflux pump CusA